MNTRIQELAEQAGFNIEKLMEPYPGGFPREDILALESFAELIVRECMVLCKTSAGNADYNTGRLHCLENIKEHFGVEE